MEVIDGCSNNDGISIPPPGATGRLDRFVTALSNYDNNATTTATGNPVEQQPWEGIESDDLQYDRPVVLHGSNGILGHHFQSLADIR